MTDGINSEHKQESRQPSKDANQQGGIDSRPPGGTLETLHANTDEMEALCLTNQRLLRELEQLTRQMQRPQEVRQAREDQNPITQEEQQHPGPPQQANGEGKASQVREHDPYKPPEENRNKKRHGVDDRSDGPVPYQ